MSDTRLPENDLPEHGKARAEASSPGDGQSKAVASGGLVSLLDLGGDVDVWDVSRVRPCVEGGPLEFAEEELSVLQEAHDADNGSPSWLKSAFGLMHATGEKGAPKVRLVRNAWSRKPVGYATWDRETWDLDISTPVGPAWDAARTAVSGVLADTLVGGLYGIIPSLGGQDGGLAVADRVIRAAFEPESVFFLAVNLTTRVAAAHVVPPPLAALAGNYVEALCRDTVHPARHETIEAILTGLDVIGSVEQGNVTDLRSPATDQLAGQIARLLGSGPADARLPPGGPGSIGAVASPEWVRASEPPRPAETRRRAAAAMWSRIMAQLSCLEGVPRDYLWLIVLTDPEFARARQRQLADDCCRTLAPAEMAVLDELTWLLDEQDRRLS